VKKALDTALLFIIAFVILRFVITPTRVPTGSMLPTIEPNDCLIINRLPYYFTAPKRGEVVSFHHKKTRLIKRVIAVPGDTLDIRGGKVYVNGKELDEPYLYEEDSTYEFMMADNSLPLEIAEDRYFVMGDNRDDSEDSRYFGMIHRKAIYAKPFINVWPLNRIKLVK